MVPPSPEKSKDSEKQKKRDTTELVLRDHDVQLAVFHDSIAELLAVRGGAAVQVEHHVGGPQGDLLLPGVQHAVRGWERQWSSHKRLGEKGEQGRTTDAQGTMMRCVPLLFLNSYR